MSKIPSLTPYGVTPNSQIRTKPSNKVYRDGYDAIKGFNGTGQVKGHVTISYVNGKRVEKRNQSA